jgi:archaellum component FlaG (FlaF/FlaG flagellin family)
MSNELIICIISFIFTSGVIYGTLNNRLKHIETMVNSSSDIAERLAKIEGQIQILINQLNKIK